MKLPWDMSLQLCVDSLLLQHSLFIICFFLKGQVWFTEFHSRKQSDPLANVCFSDINGECSRNQKNPRSKIHFSEQQNPNRLQQHRPSALSKIVAPWFMALTAEELWEGAAQLWEIRRSTCLLWSPSGSCWAGDALSECPAKVGGEWLAEVYGDLWLLPQALIASSSVGSPGRPAVSSDQHQGSCRWAHQNTVYWDLLWRQMVSRSAPKPDDKQRGGREKRRDGQLVAERVQDFNLAFRDTKKRVMGACALLVPIRHLSLRSAVIK